jgi:penicillin-binding protein 1A
VADEDEPKGPEAPPPSVPPEPGEPKDARPEDEALSSNLPVDAELFESPSEPEAQNSAPETQDPAAANEPPAHETADMQPDDLPVAAREEVTEGEPPNPAESADDIAAPLQQPSSEAELEPPASAVEPAPEVALSDEPSAEIETPAVPPPASPSEGALPPNYFQAAGDPDESPAAPDSALGARLGALFSSAASSAGETLSAFGKGARSLGDEVANRAGQIARPRSVRKAAVWAGWIIGGFVALLVGFFVFVTWGMPSTDDLWEARNGQSITFLDRNGHVILREGAQNAPPVDLASLPAYVPQAFVAIEDRRFYQHFGVDFGGMMRAGAENLRAGHVVQGGSTITQQLAKNLFLTNERSWRRKLQEVAMAIWLETKFTKDEILALYLSRVYFGAGAYGVEAAAERYFDRPARELTLLQAATLAGLVKAPSRLNPASQDIAGAKARAGVVLNEMVSMGYISDAERQAALQEELVVSRRNPAGVLSYFRDWIDPTLSSVIGTQRDDFIVETTLDIAAQRAGNEAVNSVLNDQGEAKRVSQAGLLAMDDTGGVRAMIGGRDYDVSQFNRATQARRQPGSSFKFFIYLTAMEHGLSPYSVRLDEPVVVHIPGQPDWTPGNYEHEYHGPVPLIEALADSYNMVAIRLTQELGGQNVIDTARRLGVRSELHNYPSLGLGAQVVTLMEMTQAYGTMAAGGYNIEPHGIIRIRRAGSDEVMWSWRPERHVQLIEDRPRRLMDFMMNRVVEAGTGTHARIPGRQIAGKTGTGNDYRDAWFIGFTPGMVAGVWAGNDNFTPTNKMVGGSVPADIWHQFMQVALRNEPSRPLDMPTPEDMAIPTPEAETVQAVGAPIGAVVGSGPPPSAGPQQPGNTDHSLDVGPQG